MFKKIQTKQFNKRIDNALNKRDRSGLNDIVRTVGILYNGDHIKDVKFFKDLSSKLTISEEKFTFLGFVTFDKKQPSLPKHICTKKDFSWFGDVKTDSIKDFIGKEFDMLISYYDNENKYLDIITAKSKACFKVGCADSDERLFDLILGVKTGNKNGFNTEILKYLKILEKL